MDCYLIPIKYGIILFPFIAILITIPYMINQYHKYGSVHKLRVIIIYSFILYLLCAYFLVILPLPSIESVKHFTGKKYNLELFHAFKVFFSTYSFANFKILDFIKQPVIYEAFFNTLLTLPFGIYLRYYFKFSFWKTLLCSFLLSLFFEVSQLTGLFFIYPRNYRLYDVDDLFINTLGGVVGFLIAPLFMKFLPSRDKIDNDAFKMGREVSFLRRVFASAIDLIIYIIIIAFYLITIYLKHSFNINNLYIVLIITGIYYLLLPVIFSGNSIGKRIVSIKVDTFRTDKFKRIKIFFRYLLLYFVIIPLPVYILIFYKYYKFSTYILISSLMILFIIYILMIYKMIRKEHLLYEIVSGTENISLVNNINEECEIVNNN